MPPKKPSKATKDLPPDADKVPKDPTPDMGYTESDSGSESSGTDAGYTDSDNNDPALTATPSKKNRPTGPSATVPRSSVSYRTPTKGPSVKSATVIPEMFRAGTSVVATDPTEHAGPPDATAGVAGSAGSVDPNDPHPTFSDFEDVDDEAQTGAKKAKKRVRAFTADTKSGNRTAPCWRWYRDSLSYPGYACCQAVVEETTGRICGKRIKRGDAATKGLNDHLKLHPKVYAEFLKLRAEIAISKAIGTLDVREGQKALMSATDQARELLGKPALARKGPITRTIDDYFESQQSLVPFPSQSKSQKRLDLEVMLFLARTCLPFSLADHPAFKR